MTPAPHPTPAASPERIKCLVVDDVEENLVALEALLQCPDVEVLKAASGPAALELLLQHNDVALALLDVQMPEMNGFELAELIRGSERTRHVPLIFITAGSRDQNWQFKGYESGAVDFLYKPIDPHMLATKAEVFFELHRQKHALACQLAERTEALRVNEMFMAVLGHDLRNPLTAILAAASLVQRQSDPEKAHALASKILTSGRRMGRMIEDLLDVTRVRHAGGLGLHPGPTQLDAIVQRAAQELRTSFPQRDITVRPTGPLDGAWDAERLGQVASNLIGNAVHHGTAGSPVEVRLDGNDADWVEMQITNAGEIPPQILPQLFDPFRRRDREAGQHQGLGLGLYIVRQIVQAHGGTIQVASSQGKTTFTVRLPRTTAAVASPSAHGF